MTRYPRRRTLRARLALLYAGLFAGSGAALLIIADLPLLTFSQASRAPRAPLSGAHAGHPASTNLPTVLMYSGIALAVLIPLSVALGWLVAGRALRPLRVITSAASAISASGLDERLSLDAAYDEFTDLKETLNRLFGRLQDAFESQRHFVANAAHELRTPLTVVNGFVETMQDMPNLENDMARRALQLMGDQTRRMENLVNDLLTLSRLENEQNALQEENLDVPQLLAAVLQEGMLLSNGQHQFKLDIESNSNISGSINELHSAFGNLVTNAIRYTPAAGDIVLRWFEQPDGHMVFCVKDSGIGIAPQHISRLTERFYRVDRSRSRETGGTGLGLAIVKHIAMRHQAQLNIASEEGKGSTFSIVFPVKRRVPESDPTAIS